MFRPTFTTFFFALVAFQEASAFAPAYSKSTKTSTTSLEMASDVDRRTFVTFAGATLAAIPSLAHALDTIPADNEILKEQRTVTSKLDVNNSPVADYMKYPGLYPTIAGKIANNGPYKSVDQAFKLPLLTSEEKSKLKQYKSQFVATKATGLDVMRGRDPYRTSFNDFKEVRKE